jgi:hypothetical protein
MCIPGDNLEWHRDAGPASHAYYCDSANLLPFAGHSPATSTRRPFNRYFKLSRTIRLELQPYHLAQPRRNNAT